MRFLNLSLVLLFPFLAMGEDLSSLANGSLTSGLSSSSLPSSISSLGSTLSSDPNYAAQVNNATLNYQNTLSAINQGGNNTQPNNPGGPYPQGNINTLAQQSAIDANAANNPQKPFNPNDPTSLVDLCPQACQIASGSQLDTNCLGQCVRTAVLGPQAAQPQQDSLSSILPLILILGLGDNNNQPAPPPVVYAAPDIQPALFIPPPCGGKHCDRDGDGH